MLLGLLVVVLVVSSYVMLFYIPMTTERDRCISETEVCRVQVEAAEVRLEDKRRMERELKELFAQEVPPVSIADYDNLKPIMFELNTILAAAEDYTLSFSTVDASQTIVRRSIDLSFTAASYDAAKTVLQRLHDSAFRCMLDNLSLNLGEGGGVSVTGTIVYFEYQEQPQTQTQQEPEPELELDEMETLPR